MRARWLVSGGAVAVVVVGAVAFTRIDAAPTTTPPADPAVQTATVVRTDLTEQDSQNGTLGYGPETTVPGQQQGTVTWLPAPGTVIARGQRLYAVDARPVILFYGSTPLYRTVDATTTAGADVQTVKDNLTELGFLRGRTLPAAIKAWQKSLGLTQTGAIAPADVAVLAGPVRASGAAVAVGERAGGDVLKVTGTDRVVTVALDTEKQTEAVVDGKVALALPAGGKTTGTVTDVGVVATATDKGGSTIPVTIKLDDPAAAGRLVAAPVTVTFTTGKRTGVLAVPVNALLALREGGYGLELADGHRLIAVQTGLFADGQVEVTGADLRAGLKVVTAS